MIPFKNLIRGRKKKKGRTSDRGMFEVVSILPPEPPKAQFSCVQSVFYNSKRPQEAAKRVTDPVVSFYLS